MISWEWLGQAIDDAHLGINLSYIELFLGYELSDVMKPYLNVFHLCMIDWVSNEVYCTLRVSVDGRRWMVD